MVLSTPVFSYRASPPLAYGATPRQMDTPAEPRKAVVAAAIAVYAALSIAMTLAFKRALAAFPYPASLVAATFVVEAALVKSAECGARCGDAVFPKGDEAPPEKKPCCVFPDATERLLVYIACCVGAEVALSNAGLALLSVATHTMIKACTPVFVLAAGLALKLEPCHGSSVAIVACITVGTVLCAPGVADGGDQQDSLVGVLLTVGGGAVGGLRWGLTQKATQRDATVKPTELVRRTLPTSAAFMVLVAGVLDARRLIRTPGAAELAQNALGASLALALGGLALLTVEVTLVALTSSLTLAVAAVAKELVLIGVSIGALKDAVAPVDYAGFSLTASGVLAYNLQRMRRRRTPRTYAHVETGADLRPPTLASIPAGEAELA